MSFVTIKLKDQGHAIETTEFKLKGQDSQVVKETELVKKFRKKGVIITVPVDEPKKPDKQEKFKKSSEANSSDEAKN